MKSFMILLAMAPLLCCGAPTERKFTASTPADAIVKTFLRIPLTDSVDFIRWKLTLTDDHYSLECNYGIGKPNTNGFYDGGKTVSLNGAVKKEKNYYQLRNGDKMINLLELNNNLLHFLDTDNTLLIGNGGWSYTLNNINATNTDEINSTARQTEFNDSIVFEGRTPCGIPGVIPTGKECYKLKWYLAFYPAAGKNVAPQYRLWGTLTYKEGGKRGTWSTITTKTNHILYCLNNDEGKPFIYLLKADENILLFTDANGKPLTGDQDFSYTLNKKRPRGIAG
jgi:hypothetical protein